MSLAAPIGSVAFSRGQVGRRRRARLRQGARRGLGRGGQQPLRRRRRAVAERRTGVADELLPHLVEAEPAAGRRVAIAVLGLAVQHGAGRAHLDLRRDAPHAPGPGAVTDLVPYGHRRRGVALDPHARHQRCDRRVRDRLRVVPALFGEPGDDRGNREGEAHLGGCVVLHIAGQEHRRLAEQVGAHDDLLDLAGLDARVPREHLAQRAKSRPRPRARGFALVGGLADPPAPAERAGQRLGVHRLRPRHAPEAAGAVQDVGVGREAGRREPRGQHAARRHRPVGGVAVERRRGLPDGLRDRWHGRGVGRDAHRVAQAAGVQAVQTAGGDRGAERVAAVAEGGGPGDLQLGRVAHHPAGAVVRERDPRRDLVADGDGGQQPRSVRVRGLRGGQRGGNDRAGDVHVVEQVVVEIGDVGQRGVDVRGGRGGQPLAGREAVRLGRAAQRLDHVRDDRAALQPRARQRAGDRVGERQRRLVARRRVGAGRERLGRPRRRWRRWCRGAARRMPPEPRPPR